MFHRIESNVKITAMPLILVCETLLKVMTFITSSSKGHRPNKREMGKERSQIRTTKAPTLIDI